MAFKLPQIDLQTLATGWNRTLLLGAGAFAGVVLTAAAIHFAKTSGTIGGGALRLGGKRYR